MRMTAPQLETCFTMLRSYWPGEWDENRYLIWAEAFNDLDYDTAVGAVKAMGRTAKYPTVAELLQHTTRPTNTVIDDDDRMFLPGTGWINKPKPPAELEEGDAQVIDLTELRREMHRRLRPDRGAEA
jgi:hypothetical protein